MANAVLGNPGRREREYELEPRASSEGTGLDVCGQEGDVGGVREFEEACEGILPPYRRSTRG